MWEMLIQLIRLRFILMRVGSFWMRFRAYLAGIFITMLERLRQGLVDLTLFIMELEMEVEEEGIFSRLQIPIL